MALPLKKAKEEYGEALAQLREALVAVTGLRFDLETTHFGSIPGVLTEATYLLNIGQHNHVRNLLDLHDACTEAQVNLDIATQSVKYEHGIDPDVYPDYLGEESEEPPIRILERDYARVVEGDPAHLGTGMDAMILRLARLDPDEV
jgi:hypothetical protein